MPDPYTPPGSTRAYDVPADLDAVDVSAWFQDFADTVDGHVDATIAKALVDAKGDLIVATAGDTVTRLAVGTDGQVLTADTAEAGGMKWADPAGFGNLDGGDPSSVYGGTTNIDAGGVS